MAEQVVPVFHAHSRHGVAPRPRQIRFGEPLEHLSVVDERGLAVGREQVGQVESLAKLHPGRIIRRADEVAAVVHVDVQVGAVPAVGGGVEQSPRIALHEA